MIFFAAAVEQGFCITLYRRERSSQLVRDVGDKVAACLLDAFRLGEIAQYGNRASAGQGSCGHIKAAAGKNRSRTSGSDLAGFRGVADGAEKIGVADGLDYGSVQAGAVGGQAVP